MYRGTSLTRNTPLLGPCSRTMDTVVLKGGAASYERGTPVASASLVVGLPSDKAFTPNVVQFRHGELKSSRLLKRCQGRERF